MGSLDDKVVVVTGAASGFGREIARQVAERGALAVAADADGGGALRTVHEITAAGFRAHALTLDVRERESFREGVEVVVGQYGRLDVLVNNAGIMPLAFFADHAKAAEAWDRCIDVNLKGVVNGVSAVYDAMISQGSGHIVNIASIYGNAGVAGAAVYGATKAAVIALSDALRVETRV